MQQRKSALGRPSGTDGSDFSYRMVVDPRYTKVAQGKSRLRVLIFAQAVIQVIGVLCTFLFTSKESQDRLYFFGRQRQDRLAITSIVFGFFSIIIGELGRRRSQVYSLKIYATASSIATLCSIACIFRNDMLLEVIQHGNGWATRRFELIEAGRALLSVPLQIFTINTTVSLIQNMSLPKRAS